MTSYHYFRSLGGTEYIVPSDKFIACYNPNVNILAIWDGVNEWVECNPLAWSEMMSELRKENQKSWWQNMSFWDKIQPLP